MSASVSGGGTVSVDASADNSHSKTKTLATLGNGNVDIADKENSDIAMLNRDIADNEVDIYDIESHKGLKGSLDTRLLSKDGRADIAEEVKKSKVGFYDVAKDIMTNDELTILDSFSHQGNKVDFFDGMQEAIKNDKDLRDILSDPNATKEQKTAAMQEVASSVAAKLEIDLGAVTTIATDATKTTADGEAEIKGAYHDGSGDIVINDKNIDNTGDAVNTLGHELVHAVGYGEDASKVMGESLEGYADFGMWNRGEDGQTLAGSNNHVGTVDKETEKTIVTTDDASKNFVERHDKGELKYELKDAVAGFADEVTFGASGELLKATTGYDPDNLSLKDKADYYTGKEIAGANPVGQLKKGVKKVAKDVVEEGVEKATRVMKKNKVPAVGTELNSKETKVAGKLKSEKAALKKIGEKNKDSSLNGKINQKSDQKVFEDKIGFKHEKSISGKKANEKAGKDQKEWNDNDIVKEGTLPKGQKPDTIARAHKDENNMARPYLGDKTQMKNKTESQLKKEYALPKEDEYNQVTDYKGTKDKKVLIGKTGKNDWGEGGNTQVKVQKQAGKRLEAEDFYEEGTPVKKP